MSKWDAKQPEAREDWLMSYADMITLLMAFFILLLSMSKIDPIKYEKVEGGMAKDIGKRDVEQPLQKLKSEMGEVLKGLKLDENTVGLGTDDRGLVLEFDANAFFEQGSARLKDEMLTSLIKICQTLDSPKYSAFQVEVQGHTDDNQVATPAYPSNWELSAGRAAMVVRLFIKNGMDPTRLSALGFADTRPKVSNRDVNGNPVALNQAINRRVTMHVFPR
jgi:chemotaxis protein MotB